ncbi:MAG: hypothetical protein H0T62_11375 [Parachlamydiaceae bacterium]|nr:hypothetical protein [Parachlamydiaceae bacterium]
MRKIIWLQVLAASVSLPIAAIETVIPDAAPAVIMPTPSTSVDMPMSPVVSPPVVAPSPVISPPVVPTAVTPPIQSVPALPVPAISSQPASPPYVPFSSSYIPVAPGSSTYYDPYGPGPGLRRSPLDARLNAPLGLPWSPPAARVSSVAPLAVPGYIPGRRSVPLAPIPPQVRSISHGHFGEPAYLFPGLVRLTGDNWVGSDYLYNLAPTIGVAVELIVPPEISSVIFKNRIRTELEGVFSSYGITPYSEAIGEMPPLPFFHLIAFVAPVQGKYVLNITGRLFEEVKVPRLNYQLPGTWQAITWEKQELLISAGSQLVERLSSAASEIALMFVRRVSHYNRQQLEQRDALRVEGPPVGALESPFLHQHSPCCSQ